MNKKTLMEFIQHIAENCSARKAGLAYSELKSILEKQSAPEEFIRIAHIAIQSVPEVKSEVIKGKLTEEDMEIIYKRAQARMELEEAARRYGRC